MGKTLFGGTTQQVFMGLGAALMFIMAIEASQVGFDDGFSGFFGWDGNGHLGWHSSSITDDDGLIKVRVREKGCKIKLDKEGEVTFSDDERDIVGLESGGFLALEVRGCGDKFELKATPGTGGPAIAAKLDGQDTPWNEATRARFHDALQIVFETTDFDAQGRVDRLYKKGGAAAVLEVAQKMSSDWAQRMFLQKLLAKDDLGVDDTEKVWRIAGRSLGSDYELAQMIQEAPARHAAEPQVKAAVVDALRSLGSDYELRRTLDYLLEAGADAETIDALVGVAAEKVSSDYEQAEFLLEVADTLPPAAPLPAALDRTLGTIHSDYELQRSLEAFVERDGLSRADLERLLQAAISGLSSDYELTQFLTAVAEHQKSAEPWPPGVEQAIHSISSDYEQGRAREAFE